MEEEYQDREQPETVRCSEPQSHCSPHEAGKGISLPQPFLAPDPFAKPHYSLVYHQAFWIGVTALLLNVDAFTLLSKEFLYLP